MALNPLINALTVPSGTEFPGTVQGLLDLLEEYLEVLGLEDFSGINYGSTTPDPDNRDLPWFRFDGGGNFLGIFTWDGSDWVIYQPRVPVGTTAERDAITDIYDEAAGGAKQFFNTDDHILYIGTGTGWDPCRPAPADDAIGDSLYFFSSQQSIATTTGTTNWTEVDISSYVTSAGLDSATIKAAIVRVNCEFSSGFTAPGKSVSVNARIWGNNTESNDTTSVLMARAYGYQEDSGCGGSDSDTGYVPMPDQEDLSLYYNASSSGSPTNFVCQYWLCGFVYQPGTS